MSAPSPSAHTASLSPRFLFIEPAPPHVHLHFSPTRRSSDRGGAGGTGGAVGQEVGAGAHGHPARERRATDARDRKSTRLNSSHLGISYAVFCLKKKKKKENVSLGSHKERERQHQRVQACRQR